MKKRRIFCVNHNKKVTIFCMCASLFNLSEHLKVYGKKMKFLRDITILKLTLRSLWSLFCVLMKQFASVRCWQIEAVKYKIAKVNQFKYPPHTEHLSTQIMVGCYSCKAHTHTHTPLQVKHSMVVIHTMFLCLKYYTFFCGFHSLSLSLSLS